MRAVMVRGMSQYRCDVDIWFFFSSRRRHTRLQGDWSSDVCSSDLDAVVTTAGSDGVSDLGEVLADAEERLRSGASAGSRVEIGRASGRDRVAMRGDGRRGQAQ